MRNRRNTSAPPIFVQFEADQSTPAFLNDVTRHTFTFHDETHYLGTQIRWLDNPSRDVEWLITLHKFYYAPGLADLWLKTNDRTYVDCLVDLITTWVTQTPVNFIAADVTARRLQNWSYAWALLQADNRARELPQPFVRLLEASIGAQVLVLSEELAPSRNHRTLELYALLVVALVFAHLPNAADWQRFALDALVDNMRTDLQSDGVHCEQSTHYHHIVLRSYLLTCRLAQRHGLTLPADVVPLLNRALDFALHVRRPDGVIPALSDSDNAGYGELLSLGAELFDRPDLAFAASGGACGAAPDKTNVLFDASGYAVFRSDWSETQDARLARHLVFDAGPTGAGNHGHLDGLAIDVSAYGRDLIVDPGRYTYDEGGTFDWRNHFRATASHSTVTVDDRNQGTLRRKRPGAKHKTVAPYYETRVIANELKCEPAYIAASLHSPNYAPVHARHIWFAAERYWVICDVLSNPGDSMHDYRLRYQLARHAHEASTLQASTRSALLTIPGLTLWIGASAPLEACLESAWVAPRYGHKYPAPRLCAAQRSREATFLSLLLPQDDDADPPRFRYAPDAQGGWRLEITIDGAEHRWYLQQPKASMQWHGAADQRSWNLIAGRGADA